MTDPASAKALVASTSDERAPLIDPYLRTKVWLCGECGEVASMDAWNRAWSDERRRRIAEFKDKDIPDDEYGAEFGLDDRMVCPRCRHVHSDDESSYVDELDALVVVIEEPNHG